MPARWRQGTRPSTELVRPLVIQRREEEPQDTRAAQREEAPAQPKQTWPQLVAWAVSCAFVIPVAGFATLIGIGVLAAIAFPVVGPGLSRESFHAEEAARVRTIAKVDEGKVKLLAGDEAGAAILFNQALSMVRATDEAQVSIGMAYVEANDIPALEAFLTEHIRTHPKDALAHTNLAVTHHAQGRLAEAMAEYQVALQHASQLNGARLGLAQAYFEQGAYEDAWYHLERCRGGERDTRATFTDKQPWSVQRLRLAIRAEVQDPLSRAHAATALGRCWDTVPEQIMADYRAVIRAGAPGLAPLHLVAALRPHHAVADAVPSLKTTLDRSPDYAEAHLAYAQALAATSGDAARAEVQKHLDRARELGLSVAEGNLTEFAF